TFDKAGKYTIKLSVKNTNGTNSATKLKYIEVISPVKCPRKPPKKTGTSAYEEGFSVDDQIFSRSRTEYETSILPNPATDELFIQARIGTKYTLINLTGNMLIKGTVKSNTEKIDVSKYTVGTYFLKIDHEDYNEVIKIVINR
ncbi:MAG: T9SS type A sorting domain-containing protein, partial [Saprospiraceae bacterium]